MAEEILGIVGASGRSAEVDDGGLRVNPRTAFEQAVIDGRAFSWASLTYDPEAHDTILGVENNSPTELLHMHQLIFTSDTASMIHVFTASGDDMTGTAVTGVNLNRASGRVANATAKANETGNAEQAGSYAGKVLQKQVAANETVVIPLDGAVILGEDHNVGVDLTTAATAANATFIGWFEPIS